MLFELPTQTKPKPTQTKPDPTQNPTQPKAILTQTKAKPRNMKPQTCLIQGQKWSSGSFLFSNSNWSHKCLSNCQAKPNQSHSKPNQTQPKPAQSNSNPNQSQTKKHEPPDLFDSGPERVQWIILNFNS